MDHAKLFDVKDKVVVTGGSRGIGYMIATGYVQGGAKVIITSRDAKVCDQAAAELNKLGPGTCVAIPADLSELSEVKRFAEEVGKQQKAVHVLVQNAGANWGAPIDSFPDSAFTKVMTLNVQRVFSLTQALLPLLARGSRKSLSTPPSKSHEGFDDQYTGPWEDPARIIHIGSIDGIRVPNLETYSYSASKSALHQLARVLAIQLADRGITSNTLACGPFQSKMMKATLESFGEVIRDGNPLKRIGSPEDVAGACIFLSSRAGAYINGATLTVDGGAVLQSKM